MLCSWEVCWGELSPKSGVSLCWISWTSLELKPWEEKLPMLLCLHPSVREGESIPFFWHFTYVCESEFLTSQWQGFKQTSFWWMQWDGCEETYAAGCTAKCVRLHRPCTSWLPCCCDKFLTQTTDQSKDSTKIQVGELMSFIGVTYRNYGWASLTAGEMNGRQLHHKKPTPA